MVLDHLKDLLTEGLYQLGGKMGADTPHHPRAQIFLDPRQGGRWGDMQLFGLKLQTMGAIIDPTALPLEMLPGRDHRRTAHHGHRLSSAANLYPQHTEAVVRVMKGDPGHRPAQGFHRGGRIKEVGGLKGHGVDWQTDKQDRETSCPNRSHHASGNLLREAGVQSPLTSISARSPMPEIPSTTTAVPAIAALYPSFQDRPARPHRL